MTLAAKLGMADPEVVTHVGPDLSKPRRRVGRRGSLGLPITTFVNRSPFGNPAAPGSLPQIGKQKIDSEERPDIALNSPAADCFRGAPLEERARDEARGPSYHFLSFNRSKPRSMKPASLPCSFSGL